MTTIDAQFVAAARSYIGTRCVHQGRSRNGVDCIGLVVMAVRDCGLDAPLTADYGRTQAYLQFKPLLAKFCERVGAAGEGIIVLYMNSMVLHVGVLTAKNTVIHAPNEGERVKEHHLNFQPRQFWRPRWP